MRPTNKSKAEALFIRADSEEEKGRFHSAFRLMLAAAKLGDIGAQTNVGNYYDNGKGVRRNRSAALYWYKRAYRRGEAAAAHNIGTVWRDAENFKRAMYWFQRAIAMNGGEDGDASLEIAKLQLRQGHPAIAVRHLKTVLTSKNVTGCAVDEARRLLKRHG